MKPSSTTAPYRNFSWSLLADKSPPSAAVERLAQSLIRRGGSMVIDDRPIAASRAYVVLCLLRLAVDFQKRRTQPKKAADDYVVRIRVKNRGSGDDSGSGIPFTASLSPSPLNLLKLPDPTPSTPPPSYKPASPPPPTAQAPHPPAH